MSTEVLDDARRVGNTWPEYRVLARLAGIVGRGNFERLRATLKDGLSLGRAAADGWSRAMTLDRAISSGR